MKVMLRLTVLLLLALGFVACGEPDAADMRMSRTPQVRAYFNEPGTRLQTGQNYVADDILVQLIDDARTSVDFAVMGFSRDSVWEALLRARERGVQLRFVGDGRYLEGNAEGYVAMDELNIPMQAGNMYHIMHNKFFIVDGRFVVTGTGNITSSGFQRNDNNWIVIDSPQVAADFQAEFDQMFGGRFGYAKVEYENGNNYQVGDTEVEVFFSPQEDTVGELLQAVREARQSIYFYIFAFTKDELGALLIDKHLEFSRYNECCDPARRAELDDAGLTACDAEVVCETPFERREVRGVIDRSQLHGNGPYHEAYRMLAWSVPMLMDGNRNSFNPADYQAGGGRQHSKTMVIDPGTPTATVVTGSFNWSSSATVSNDETLVIMRGERITDAYFDHFSRLYDRGTIPGERFAEPYGDVAQGDIIFNEIQWDGWNGDTDPTTGEPVYNDEFIELLNTTGRSIDISLWQITDGDDFVVGFFPGTVIGPYERFLIVDHNIIPYSDTNPQDGQTAYRNAEFVMNTANDQRFLRLNLRNASLRLELSDPRGVVIDVAGDHGPPFAGGREESGGSIINYSMERVHVPECVNDPACDAWLPGELPEAWQRSAATIGGANVGPEYRDRIYATPGEPNAIGDAFPAEDPDFRVRQ